MATNIMVRYTLNPTFPPEGDNIVTRNCNKITYFYPTQGPLSPIGIFQAPPIGYNLEDTEKNTCVQVMHYQILDITYLSGYKEVVEEAINRRDNAVTEVMEQMQKKAEELQQNGRTDDDRAFG